MASITKVTQKIITTNAKNTANLNKEQLVYGKVTATAPKIKIKINSKLEVSEGSALVISSLCKPPLLASGLQVGDKVRLLSLNNNQVLYAIEKGG